MKTLMLGSGFSKAVAEKITDKKGQHMTMPITTDFFPSSKSLLDKQYEKLGTYLRSNKRYYENGSDNGYPKVNFEVVYNDCYNENNNFLERQLKELIFDNLGVNYSPTRNREEIRQTIEKIRKVIEKWNPNNIVTTNLDILLDIAIAGGTDFRKMGHYYGLPVISILGSTEGIIDNKFIELNSFLKIHGSINWVKCKECKTVYFMNRYLKWKQGISVVNHIERCCSCSCGKRNYEICVVQPMLNKKEAYEKSPWDKIWRDNLRAVLSETKELIIYGFGFGDTAMQEYFKIDLNKECKIKIFDIQSIEEPFKEKAKKWLERDLEIKFEKIENFLT